MIHAEVKLYDVKVSLEKFKVDPYGMFEQMVQRWRQQFADGISKLMDAELEIYLGKEQLNGVLNSRNGYIDRNFTVKGIGTLGIRIPRDRKGRYQSCIIPPRQRYDIRIQQDMALMHLGGMSCRTISLMSERLFGRTLSAQEVSEATGKLHNEVERWRQRPLEQPYRYLFCDGSYFAIRRGTVNKESILVVIGVDYGGCRSVLGFQGGDKESSKTWDEFFGDLIRRGLDNERVELGIMDGLTGLEDVFKKRFPKATVQRCQIHKVRNVLAKAPKRFHEEMRPMMRKVFYNEDRKSSTESLEIFKSKWERLCPDSTHCLEKDLSALLAFYDFPKNHWPSLRTTNPIERLNKEFKRRTNSMEIVGGEKSIYTLLAYLSIKMELSWRSSKVGNKNIINLNNFSLTHKT